MYCPRCGAKAEDGATACPNGHALPAGRPDAAALAGEAARKAVSALGASLPLPAEVRVIVVALKILSIAVALVSVLGWSAAASLLGQLGLGGGGALIGLVAGLSAACVLYGLGILVQVAAARAGVGA